MVDEPQEGTYDFSRYEELISHAAGLDMQGYLGLTCEQAPHWLWEKHPGCRMVCRDGRPMAVEAQLTLPADGKPGPCYDHPGARADMCRFITRLVEVLGRGEIDFGPVLSTLNDMGFTGGVNVELSRHSHMAPTVLQESYDFLQRILRAKGLG